MYRCLSFVCHSVNDDIIRHAPSHPPTSSTKSTQAPNQTPTSARPSASRLPSSSPSTASLNAPTSSSCAAAAASHCARHSCGHGGRDDCCCCCCCCRVDPFVGTAGWTPPLVWQPPPRVKLILTTNPATHPPTHLCLPLCRRHRRPQLPHLLRLRRQLALSVWGGQACDVGCLCVCVGGGGSSVE
jgi:hypothetical protein